MKKEFKVASFFAGVGGIDLGFEQAGHYRIVYANEMNKDAVKTYEENFNIKVDCRDINLVDAKEIPNFELMIAGFPCQAFSVAGYRRGFEDEKGRGVLFFELLRIIKAKKPKVVFLENVKNLKNHDNGNTYKVIKESLEKNGYYVKEAVLNADEYGNVPQNRERIYIVAFNKKAKLNRFVFPEPIELTKTIEDEIDLIHKLDDRYYYTKEKYERVFETVNINDLKKDTLYQWRRVYLRENKSNECPTLTANMGEGGHNVPLIKTNYGLRKLTPRECFNFQGYPAEYKLPENMSDSKLYKQAGNSVVVPVIKRIAEKILEAY